MALAGQLPTSEAHVLRMLSQGAPMMEVLNELCHFIDTKSPGVIPTVLLPDGDGTHLRLAAGPKVPKIWNEAFGGWKVRTDCVHGAPGREGKPFQLADMRSDPSFAACWDLALSQGIQAAWSVPILSKNREILGALILFYPTPQPPGERDLELMEQAIHMAAIAIESHRKEEELREFSRQLYQSQDAERRRIARELHDSTGQKLALLALALSVVKNGVPAESLDKIQLCESLIGGISDELRTLSYLLHPPMLDERGLTTAIQWYVDGINQRNALHVELEIDRGLRRLSEEAELAVFRVVQASLTNVHLHSKASEAKVKIERNPDGLTVTVSDNGQGIPDGVLDHSSQTKTIGIGITGMRERITQLGGRLDIETGRNGTTVRATVPNQHFRTAL
jgi:signal transduction histidine kinase